MFRQVLNQQWVSLRAAVMVFVVIGFAIPLLTVVYGGGLRASDLSRVAQWLDSAARIGMLLPGIALLLGVFFGLGVWSPDQLGKHVYALALPVPRWQYVLLRFGAGALLLAAPVGGLALGSFVAAWAVDLPSGVHAYPAQLTFRFALASLVCFALVFALASATRRVALWFLGAVGGMLLADLLLSAFGSNAEVTVRVITALITFPGPLSILTGRWALFDV
jgi:hypothetical protein